MKGHLWDRLFWATDITQLRKILAGINLKLDQKLMINKIRYKKFPLTFRVF